MAEAGDSLPVPAGTTPFDTRPDSLTPRRPLLGVALLFLGGTTGGIYAPVPFWVPLILAATALAGFGAIRHPVTRTFCLFAALGMTGWSGASLAVRPPGRTHLPQLMSRSAEALTLTGTIVDDPVLIARDPQGHDEDWIFLMAAQTVDRLGAPRPVQGRIHCRWRNPGVAPAYGQQWRFRGVLRDLQQLQPESPRRHRMAMTITGHDQLQLKADGGNPWLAACFRARRAAAVTLEAGIADQPEIAGLLKALMLGYRSDLSPEWKDLFAATGTLHIFAISGLHVGVFGTLVVTLLRTLGVPRQRWSLLLAPLLLVYVIGTGMKPSALRACVMALAFWSGPTFWRKPDAPSALALAALLIVGARPQEITSPGFILSFAVVSGILLFYPLFNRLGRDRLQPDPWRRDPEPAGIRYARRMAVGAWSLFALSLACWLISFPLTARMFSLFSPVALLGNLIVVPGAFLVVLTGCLSLVGGVFATVLAEIFNHANAIFIGWLLAVVNGMSALPLGHRYVAAPAMSLVLGWYTLLGGWRLLSPGARLRWAALLPLAIGAWILSWSFIGNRSWLQVTGADGLSILRVHAGRDTIVVGGGEAWQAEQQVDSLRRQGLNRLNALVLMRTSEDALEAAENWLMGIPIDALWLPGAIPSPWAARLQAYHVELRRLRRGERGFLADGTEWEVLALPAPGPGGPVLRFARDLDTVLYMAEPDPSAQYALTQSAIEPAASLLVLSDSRRPPWLLPAWIRDTGATQVVAARKRRLSRGDDYRRWQADLEAQSLSVRLLRHGEGLELPIPETGVPTPGDGGAPGAGE